MARVFHGGPPKPASNKKREGPQEVKKTTRAPKTSKTKRKGEG